MKIENCLLFRKVYFIEQIEMMLDQRYTDPHLPVLPLVGIVFAHPIAHL